MVVTTTTQPNPALMRYVLTIFFLDRFGTFSLYAQDVYETAVERAKRVANDRTRTILGNAATHSVSPSEFISHMEYGSVGSRQKIEDEAFTRMYRGYDASDLDSWVRLLCFFFLYST